MANYTDNLDGTGGDLLSARSGWSRPIGSDNVTLVAGGSGFYMTGGTSGASGTWTVPNDQPTGNDQYCEAYIHYGSGGNPFPLGVRCDISSATGGGYLVQVDTTTPRIRLVRRNAVTNTLAVLGTYTVTTPSDLDTNKVRIDATGTNITLTFMGSAVIGPVSDSTFASGSVAMLSRGGTATVTTNTVDDYAWGDVGAATTHAATGALTGQIGAVAGTAAHIAIHAATGALTGPGSAIVGAGDHATAGGSHAATGALVGAGSTIAGSAAHKALHAATGALTGAGAVLAGVAAVKRLHAASGALAGLQAAIAGTAARTGVAGADLTVTGGPWSLDFTITGGVRAGGITVTGGTWN